MAFGYVGYIWAMLGCACFGLVFGGSAAFLYAYGRRREREEGGASVTVERIAGGDEDGGGGGAA